VSAICLFLFQQLFANQISQQLDFTSDAADQTLKV